MAYSWQNTYFPEIQRTFIAYRLLRTPTFPTIDQYIDTGALKHHVNETIKTFVVGFWMVNKHIDIINSSYDMSHDFAVAISAMIVMVGSPMGDRVMKSMNNDQFRERVIEPGILELVDSLPANDIGGVARKFINSNLTGQTAIISIFVETLQELPSNFIKSMNNFFLVQASDYYEEHKEEYKQQLRHLNLPETATPDQVIAIERFLPFKVIYVIKDDNSLIILSRMKLYRVYEDGRVLRLTSNEVRRIIEGNQ
jgi:hypothetical protein